MSPRLPSRATRIRRRTCALLAGASLMVGVSGCPGPGPDPVTLGAVLSKLTDQVRQGISDAENRAQALELQAAASVSNAIEQAKFAYADELQKTMTSLDSVTTHKIQELQGLANDLTSQASQTVANVITGAQQIALTLPFSDKQPQLTSYSPRFEAAGQNASNVVFTLKGVFAFASRQGFTPQLTPAPNAPPIAPISNTTQQLQFEVPRNVFPAPPSGALGLTSMTLTVPYETGTIFKTHHTATYHLLVGVLPSSPGSIQLVRTTTTQRVDTQWLTTSTFQQHSDSDDIKDKPWSSGTFDGSNPAYPGWTITPGTSRFCVDWSQGDQNDQWSETFVRDQPFVQYDVTTIHHGLGTSGKVDFHFAFQVQKAVPIATDNTTDVQLQWGYQQAYPVATNAWHVDFTSFDGQKTLGIVTSQLLPYLEISVSGNNVIIHAPAVESIDYSPAAGNQQSSLSRGLRAAGGCAGGGGSTPPPTPWPPPHGGGCNNAVTGRQPTQGQRC